MFADVSVEMVPADLVLWRCLHGGPLTAETIDHPQPRPQVPWPELRARNVPLLRRLAEAYGAYAVAARDGERIAGMLRFYPKAVCALEGAGMLCLQQEFAAGPEADFAQTEFPPLAALPEKTLVVHCLMTGFPSQRENPLPAQGDRAAHGPLPRRLGRREWVAGH